MKTLYYTSYPQLEYFDSTGETNGLKDIYVYEIKDGELSLLTMFETDLSEVSEDVIAEKLNVPFEYKLQAI